MKNKLLVTLGVIFAFVLIIQITGKNYIYKALYYNYTKIDNPEIFHSRIIAAENPVATPSHKDYNKKPLTPALRTELEGLETVSLLMIKNDSVILEEYWDGYDETSTSNSFSMAKSITSILCGIAIKDGYITSVEDKISKYMPSYLELERDRISIKDILQMSSGLSWYESYGMPISDVTEAYYGTDLLSLINRRKPVNKAGKYHKYMSGDTQILGMTVSRAVKKPLSNFASERLWNRIGMERDAFWSLDVDGGEEKAYCCIHSGARDYAKLGMLWMHQGNWKGDQIVDTAYVDASIKAVNLPDLDQPNENIDYYGYQWWMMKHRGNDVFYMRGIHGQFVLCYPEEDVVIVRLGHQRGEKIDHCFPEVHHMLDFAVKQF